MNQYGLSFCRTYVLKLKIVCLSVCLFVTIDCLFVCWLLKIVSSQNHLLPNFGEQRRTVISAFFFLFLFFLKFSFLATVDTNYLDIIWVNSFQSKMSDFRFKKCLSLFLNKCQISDLKIVHSFLKKCHIPGNI